MVKGASLFSLARKSTADRADSSEERSATKPAIWLTERCVLGVIERSVTCTAPSESATRPTVIFRVGAVVSADGEACGGADGRTGVSLRNTAARLVDPSR